MRTKFASCGLAIARRFIHLLVAVLLINTPTLATAGQIEKWDRSVVWVLDFSNVDSEEIKASGTGFVISRGGFIITNAHVIGDPPSSIQVVWKDETGEPQSLPARVVTRDPNLDLALLEVKSLPLPPLQFTSHRPAKGQVVYAIGFPTLGYSNTEDSAIGAGENSKSRSLAESTVTQGIIGRYDAGLRLSIQHSAIISGGNSGGPLLDECGSVVGINTATSVDETTKGDHFSAVGYGFAIDSTAVYEFATANGGAPQHSGEACARNVAGASGAVFSEDHYSSVPNTRALVGGLILLGLVLVVASQFGSLQRTVASPQNAVAASINESSGHALAWKLLAITPDGNRPVGMVSDQFHTTQSPLVVGRGSHCGVVLGSPEISRTQFKLYFDKGQLYCADLHSANGTWLNGRLLSSTPHQVHGPADIVAGDCRLRLLPCAG